MPKAKYTKWPETPHVFLEELKRRSGERIKQNPEFHYVLEDIDRLRKKLDENRISLNEEVRRAELDEDKIRKEKRAAERLARAGEDTRVYRVTLDTVDSPNLQLIMYPGKMAAAKKGVAPKRPAMPTAETAATAENADEPRLDPLRDEALNILADVASLSQGPKTASTSAAPPGQ